MPQRYTVGLSLDGENGHVTLEAEDALAAALRVKEDNPGATITCSRTANERGDRRQADRPLGDGAGG